MHSIKAHGETVFSQFEVQSRRSNKSSLRRVLCTVERFNICKPLSFVISLLFIRYRPLSSSSEIKISKSKQVSARLTQPHQIHRNNNMYYRNNSLLKGINASKYFYRNITRRVVLV